MSPNWPASNASLQAKKLASLNLSSSIADTSCPGDIEQLMLEIPSSTDRLKKRLQLRQLNKNGLRSCGEGARMQLGRKRLVYGSGGGYLRNQTIQQRKISKNSFGENYVEIEGENPKIHISLDFEGLDVSLL